jgi:hypothetical protein
MTMEVCHERLHEVARAVIMVIILLKWVCGTKQMHNRPRCT